MSKWDNLSKKIWENSEVMNEYENLIKNALFEMNKKIEAQDLVRKMDTINKTVDDASKKMDGFLTKTKNLAEDDLAEDSDDKEPTEEEHEAAKNQLLAELTELAIKAADERDYKVAYKIERIITVISEEG
jgi:small-conductance mechanosensitive channel